MAIEIVDFPIKHGDFPLSYVKLPEGTYGWPPFERRYQWDKRCCASQVQQMCSQHSTLRFDASRAVPKKAGVIGVLTPTISRKERIWIAYNGQSMSVLLKWMIWGTSILGNPIFLKLFSIANASPTNPSSVDVWAIWRHVLQNLQTSSVTCQE